MYIGHGIDTALILPEMPVWVFSIKCIGDTVFIYSYVNMY